VVVYIVKDLLKMIIFKDLFTGDELFSDSFPVQLINETVYKVKGKLRTDTFDIDEKAIGGNASAEGGEEGADTASKQGVDIVMNSRLVEYALSKKRLHDPHQGLYEICQG